MDFFRSEDFLVFNREANMLLTEKIRKDIVSQAEDSLPNECCGFVLSKDDDLFIFPCANKFEKQFSIDPSDFLKAEKKGKIEAVYHSHPSGKESFSDIDKKNSLYHGIRYILYAVKSKSFKEFGFDPRYKKYIGKFFEIGSQDCFSLVREFYENELNIKVRNYHRDDDWESQLSNPFDEHHEEEGFARVDEPKRNDILIFKSLKRKNSSGHAAIYLGDSLMLHNRRSSFSKIEEYSAAYQRLTNYILRYKILS